MAVVIVFRTKHLMKMGTVFNENSDELIKKMNKSTRINLVSMMHFFKTFIEGHEIRKYRVW